MENKKKFENPEAIIVEFYNEDIILASGPGDPFGKEGDDFHGWWGGNN